MRKRLIDDEKQELAQGISRALNNFAGTIHAARCIMVSGIRQADDPQIRHAAKYALQVAYGAVALTMRKFEDMWGSHIPALITEKSERPVQGIWLVRECQNRNLRKSANQLIAHYADERGWPLGPSEIEALIRSNGWETEEEVVAWIGPVIEKMMEIRNEIMQRYRITSLAL